MIRLLVTREAHGLKYTDMLQAVDIRAVDLDEREQSTVMRVEVDHELNEVRVIVEGECVYSRLFNQPQ